MSKNVVDSVKDFTNETGINIGFIPSRRQISYNGGYVNNWTTQKFREYSKDSFIVRDHGGPGQGSVDDDGYESLIHDCRYFDVIHIDPWKKYASYDDGLSWTIDMINFCYERNENVLFEVATEQSIRNFTPGELKRLLGDLQNSLHSDKFENIKYCVIQSGTSLKENCNTGEYDKDRLVSMVSVVKDFGLLTKEHNGDYLPVDLIREKFDLGLDCINIAPEFGQIETKTYLRHIIDNQRADLLYLYWDICYNSRKWEKWVDDSFDPVSKKIDLINICGHYVLSNKDFIYKIKGQIPDIDKKIKENIVNKLRDLCG